MAVLAGALAGTHGVCAQENQPAENKSGENQPGENKSAETKPAQKDPSELFAELDKNGDGTLTGDEISAGQKRFFEHLLRVAGKEKDGELTKDEFVKGFKPDDLKVTAPPNPVGPGGPGGQFNPGQMFQRFDRNKDGKVTVDEVPEQVRPMIERWLKRAGKEKDGSLSLDEVKKILAENQARDASASGRPGPRSEIQSPFFRKLDTNGDGKLSKEEWQKAGALFSELDRNNDGSLDPEELFGPRRGTDGGPAGNDRPAVSPTEGAPTVKPRETKNPAEAGSQTSSQDPAGLNSKPAASETATSTPVASSTARKGRRSMALKGKGKGPGQRLDANGDGKISRDEARGRLKDKFDSIDKNADGFLERDEIRAALQQLGAK